MYSLLKKYNNTSKESLLNVRLLCSWKILLWYLKAIVWKILLCLWIGKENSNSGPAINICHRPFWCLSCHIYEMESIIPILASHQCWQMASARGKSRKLYNRNLGVNNSNWKLVTFCQMCFFKKNKRINEIAHTVEVSIVTDSQEFLKLKK